jgi:hypothetical protein
MLAAARAILVFVGALTVLLGLFLLAQSGARLAGLITVLCGAAILIALLYERLRYRSEHAEAQNDPIGPGGGEPGGTVPSGFRATTEVFVDPTTGLRMRVYLEETTGARRYIAEGAPASSADRR